MGFRVLGILYPLGKIVDGGFPRLHPRIRGNIRLHSFSRLQFQSIDAFVKNNDFIHNGQNIIRLRLANNDLI
mgnify:CR=1 FL=1